MQCTCNRSFLLCLSLPIFSHIDLVPGGRLRSDTYVCLRDARVDALHGLQPWADSRGRLLLRRRATKGMPLPDGAPLLLSAAADVSGFDWDMRWQHTGTATVSGQNAVLFSVIMVVRP